MVRSLGLCYNCLRANHLISDCRSSTCKKCKRKHHTLLHFENELASQQASNSSVVNLNPIASLQAIVTPEVLLSTAVIFVLNNREKPTELLEWISV